MKNSYHNNFYARINDKCIFDEIIMPNPDGMLERRKGLDSRHWYAVQWPLNPHFTGKSVIIYMLNQLPLEERQAILNKLWKPKPVNEIK